MKKNTKIEIPFAIHEEAITRAGWADVDGGLVCSADLESVEECRFEILVDTIYSLELN